MCHCGSHRSVSFTWFAEKYFEMPKKQCRDALDIYKKFLVRMERVSEFLKVAEVSVVKVIISNTIPSSFLFQMK